LMWQGDCGILPVVHGDGMIAGVVTDRDIAVAAATRDRTPSQIRAAELVGAGVISCKTTDEISAALALMSEGRVRRLPVLSPDGVLVGMLAMNDIILEAIGKNGLVADDVVGALKRIGAHHHPLAPRSIQAPVAVKRKGSARAHTRPSALSPA